MPSKSGFEESGNPTFESGATRTGRRERVRLGEGGRFVIPAAMREAMGVKPGDELVLHVVDGELRVRNWRDAIRRIQAEAARLKKPGASVVDEFLKGRRAMWGE